VRHAVHGEGVEPDFFFHWATLGTLSFPLLARSSAGLAAEIVAFRLALARQIRLGARRVDVPCRAL
jgi:hypothetical protein